MERRIARLLAALVAAWIWLAAAGWADAQPAVTHVSPGAVARGKTTEITLQGGKLGDSPRLWTSFPAQVEWLGPGKSDAKEVKCRVEVPQGAGVGIAGLAVATGEAVSDVAYLMVDDLASVADAGSNHSPSAAQKISLPVAVDGLSDGTLADYYRVKASVGQRISCEVVATRLGWDFDALVRVLDADGKELLLVDDDPASGPDARFVFTAPVDGEYLLEVRDNRYKPSGRYRLRLGDFSIVSTPMPLVVQRGTMSDVDFLGPRVEPQFPLSIVALGGRGPAMPVSVGTRSVGAGDSGWALLGVTDLPVCNESATNGEARVIEPPCVASGVVGAAGERDLFEFAAKKGTQLRFRAVTRSLGSAAVLALHVLDARGRAVATSPATESDEPVLPFNVPADGMYRLAVEELVGRGGTDYGYAVECQTGPQFSLLLKNDKNNKLKHSVAAGGTINLDVQCQRAGYEGPIHLAIESDRPGWQVTSGTIAAKANEVKLSVQAPADFAPGELAALRIIGRGKSAGQPTLASMTTTVQLRAARPQMPYPPAWHDGLIFAVGEAPKLAAEGKSK